MKAIHWIIAAGAFASVQPTQAGINDPEVIIYRFPGVFDDGGVANSGVATVFHCTNFSGATENIRLATRDAGGILKQNFALPVSHLSTHSWSTHESLAYPSQTFLNTGLVAEGTTAIAATSINVVCTAMTIDAASTKPAFAVSLHGIRLSPVPGSQE